MFWTGPAFRRRRLACAAAATALALFIHCFVGCASVKKAAEAPKKIARLDFIGGKYKNRIGILPFENNAGPNGRGFEEFLEHEMIQGLAESCDELILLNLSEPENFEAFQDLPRNAEGQIDNLYLAQAGRQMGLNAILAVRLVTVESYVETEGIFWFRDQVTFARVSVMADLFDPCTGSKILDASETRVVEVDTFGEEGGAPDSESVEDALIEAADNLIESICEAATDHRWAAFVIAVEGEKIILSTGSQSGLEPGERLDVFDSGKIIEGAGGYRFIRPGKKTGEIEISAVYPDRSVALVVSDGDILPGNVARPLD